MTVQCDRTGSDVIEPARTGFNQLSKLQVTALGNVTGSNE